ncbi:imelysin family protein [Lunatimonas salinarum]|uniref:imelysin family protein n=1 Tax=Lunatimonas salinarum TaxID=1774590 RepID=UPI001ADED537|nr:imelysin family protein [Lunatimonas salinarum]
MTRRIYPSVLVVMLVLIGFASCEETEGPEITSFDRGSMLENFARNLVIPAYTDLQSKVGSLENSAEAFVQNPTESALVDLQNAWEEAYTSWQYANAYNFGPAGAQGVRRALVEEIGTFPVSAEKIEDAIVNSPNFNDFNRDARGFLAVEYLIFGSGASTSEIVEDFAAQERGAFLTGAVADIDRRVTEVLTAWNDGYVSGFIQNKGTDVGSSTSMLYNEFVKSFEGLKNFKLGLPLGLRPGQTQAEPALVEAYYSGKSVAMIAGHLNAVENIWYGRTRQGQAGIGFRDYLESVVGGPALVTATENQLVEVRAALSAIPTDTPLSAQIQTSPEAADRLHTELQRHTRFFKSDMSSLLGISITFSSGDGD